MHIYYNDRLTEDAVLQANSHGFQFGYGVFETILVADALPCFFDRHYKRLLWSCQRLGLKLKIDADTLYNQAAALIETEDIKEGRLKIICFRDTNCDSVIMTLMPYSRTKLYNMKGLALGISSIKRNPHSPLSYLKSLNYAESIIAKEEAVIKGCDEALFMNISNKLCEGAVSNLFWVKDGSVYTPSVDCGILAGITRSQVMELCDAMKIPFVQGSFELKDLLQAEEVFITNSLMGITPVNRVEDICYEISSYKLTPQLHFEYSRLLEQETKQL